MRSISHRASRPTRQSWPMHEPDRSAPTVALGDERRGAELRADTDEREHNRGERDCETDDPLNHEAPPRLHSRSLHGAEPLRGVPGPGRRAQCRGGRLAATYPEKQRGMRGCRAAGRPRLTADRVAPTCPMDAATLLRLPVSRGPSGSRQPAVGRSGCGPAIQGNPGRGRRVGRPTIPCTARSR